MSVEALSLVLNHSKAVGTDKVVLIGIANHDGDGGSWPSISTLARYANVQERAAQSAIARLVDMGELEVVVNAGGRPGVRRDRRPNLYRILIQVPVDSEMEAVDDGVSSTTPRSARGVVHGSHGVSPTTPEPSLEPSTPLTPRERGARAIQPAPPRKCTKHVKWKHYCADCQLPPEPPRPPLPDWCGTCDPEGQHDPRARMVPIRGRPTAVAKCPSCHPSTTRRPA